MKKLLKVVIGLGLIYLLVGLIMATKWALSYDPAVNSFPNNSISFILNTLFWAF